jgi:translation initiation factor IF-2
LKQLQAIIFNQNLIRNACAHSHIILSLSGSGCAQLAAAVLLQAELASVSAAPDAPADGTVIESRLDKGLGPVFVCIIRDGMCVFYN